MAKKSAHPGCLVLFGLVFVILGSIPGCVALHDLSSASGTAGWTATEAELLEVGQDHGDDTWSVTARYRYRAPDAEALEGGALRDYEGTRVGTHSGSDNIGSWQHDTYNRLRHALDAGQRVPCWYDPADPAQAVLDRGTRWELVGFMFVFPLIFGLAGGAIAWIGWRQWRRRSTPESAPVVVAPPARMILADNRGGCALWIVALIWNGLSAPVLFVFLPDAEAPLWAKALFALFPLIGAGLLWAAALGSLRRLRHGRPALRLDDTAWYTGRLVHATVLVRTATQPGDRIAAELAVVRRVTTGSGDDERTTEHTLWSFDLRVPADAARRDGDAWAHQLSLPLPSDLPLPDDTVTWRLDWRIVRPGPDLSARFVLPVTAGDDGAVLVAGEIVAQADRADPLAVLRKAGVAVSEERGEVVVSLPSARNPGLWGTGLVLTLLLSGGAAALATEAGWWTALLSGPVLLLCWRGALRSLFWRSTIRLGAGRIAVEAGWWRLERHELRLTEIASVDRRTSMSSNGNAWYNLWLLSGDGARIAIARGLPEAASARLAELIDSARS